MTIWWCKEHRASSWGRGLACHNSSNGRICRLVEMGLIPVEMTIKEWMDSVARESS